MSKPAISVEDLSKQYRIGAPGPKYRTLSESLSNSLTATFKALRGKDKTAASSFWALQNVGFTVQAGEVVGIIGRNGAGKSTLLKILSRITEPTSGRVRVRGRMASLLEVGTGFHAELSGRENVYLNGAILGMSRREIQRKFDEIVSFSEVEQFIDTPVKRYSSGMYLRLAFAVAAHLEPEILVVDEVLAVGDASFQKRCLGKMRDVAHEGRTVLFVSHNMQAVSTLTHSCIVLANGRVIYHGDTSTAISEYLRSGDSIGLNYRSTTTPNQPAIRAVEISTSESGNVHRQGAGLSIQVDIYMPQPIPGARLGIRALNALHQPAMYLWAYDSDRPWCRQSGTHRIRFDIPRLHLGPDHYHLELQFAEPYGGRMLEHLECVCPFEVAMIDRLRDGGWTEGGAAYFEDFTWTLEGTTQSDGFMNENETLEYKVS